MSAVPGLRIQLALVAILFLSALLLPAQAQARRKLFLTPPYVARLYARNLPGVRTILVDAAGDLMVLARDSNQVIAIHTRNASIHRLSDFDAFIADPETKTGRTALLQPDHIRTRLTHGLAYFRNHIYASTSSEVLRWPYTPGSRQRITVGPEVVVRNIDDDSAKAASGHFTRTILISQKGVMYVSVGSASNVDKDSRRSRIRRLNLGRWGERVPAGGADFQDMEVFADGLRNTVGLAFDHKHQVWGVDNGADMLFDSDHGGDIHNNNPAEELNLFNQPSGRFYGYPFCYSEFRMRSGLGRGQGTQWLWPSFKGSSSGWTDARCKDKKENIPPRYTFQAHSAPLGLVFIDPNSFGCNGGDDIRPASEIVRRWSIPCHLSGDVYIANHVKDACLRFG